MKRVGMVLLVAALLTSCAAGPGLTEGVKIELGTSNTFSADEIQAAADCVLEKFVDFRDCTLTDLWYDEEYSNREIASRYTPQDDRKNHIVLLCNFDVGPAEGNGGFTANSTYLDWMWLLSRSDPDSDWEIESWGY